MARRWQKPKPGYDAPTLFDQPAVRPEAGGVLALPANPSRTSQEAAKQIEHVVGSQLERVLEFIRSRGAHGATNEEIEAALRMKIQSVCARTNTLAKPPARIVDSGRKRKTTSGCEARVWIASEEPAWTLHREQRT